jgi:hypothetical protein
VGDPDVLRLVTSLPADGVAHVRMVGERGYDTVDAAGDLLHQLVDDGHRVLILF